MNEVEINMDNLNNTSLMIKSIGSDPIGTGFLAFRDLGIILKKYIKGNNALDFGCGAGRSSFILKKNNMDVTGVDISSEMISIAKSKNKNINFILINKDNFSDIGMNYDMIFVSFVIMELKSKNEIIHLFKELKKILAENGKIIVITASDYFYTSDWLSVKTDMFENRDKKSGEKVNVYLMDYDVVITDYLWREQDCDLFFKESNLAILDKIKPLGVKSDNKKWKEELVKNPFIIYVLSKN